jgi:hypothetical protein
MSVFLFFVFVLTGVLFIFTIVSPSKTNTETYSVYVSFVTILIFMNTTLKRPYQLLFRGTLGQLELHIYCSTSLSPDAYTCAI